MRSDAKGLTAAVGGRLISADPESVAQGELSVDSRLLAAGDVFLALPGASTDGKQFLVEAVRRGAHGIIGPQPAVGRAFGEAGPRIAIAVEDPLEALRSFARHRRQALRGHVIGVTGAMGKTTTVDMLAAAVGRSLRTHATRHGFNTHIGVAATIAAAPENCEALVVELSMHARGHIARKAALLRPTAAVLTHIAPAHLETAGTTAEVARNKAELIRALPAGAPCVVPAGESLLTPHLRSDLRTIRHGPGGDVALHTFAGRVATIDCAGAPIRVRTTHTQPHNLRNLVTVVATLYALGLPVPDEVSPPLSPLRWQRVMLGPVELILDCASSTPVSLCWALESLASEPAGRRLAVLGPIAMLGAQSTQYHRHAGAQAARLGIDVLIGVGSTAEDYVDGYRRGSNGQRQRESHSVRTPEEARSLLMALGRPGDRALVKGSRLVELERIAP